jgi:LuxR family maltose regulon positive regulatory protein
MRDRTQDGEFLVRFAGSNRHLVDYLVPEVLGAQPPELRSFLLRSSILDTLTGPVCDEVLDRSGSAETLRELERSNLFLIPLDETGETYRYHRLFAELLRFELAQEGPEVARELHARAAAVLEQLGSLREAVGHAIAADRPRLARDLVLRNWLHLVRGGQHETVHGMLQRLGSEAVESDGALALVAAWVAGARGESRDAVERWLRLAEARVPVERSSGAGSSLGLQVALVRAAFPFDDVGSYVEAAERLLGPGCDRQDALFQSCRLIGWSSLALGRFMAGRPQDAERALAAAACVDSTAWPLRGAFSAAVRAFAECQLGRTTVAATSADAAMRLVEESGAVVGLPVGLAHEALGMTLALRGELVDAEAVLEKAVRLVEFPLGNIVHAHASLELARVRVRRGEILSARAILTGVRETLAASADPGMLPGLADEIEHELAVQPGSVSSGEALSDAELRVLRLLTTRLTQREIGRELYLSFNTVKTHMRVIHRKLGVTSREEAVAAGRRMGLI